MKSETLARLILLGVLVAVTGGVLAARQLPSLNGSGEKLVDVHASMPESGGWSPSAITVQAGQSLHLRLTSDDVMHGFAIGQFSQPVVDLAPGEVNDVTLKFDQPGSYTFYCTRWCGPNHWRMRGTIQILPRNGQAVVQPAQPEKPLYTRLGLDLDAKPPSITPPESRPSARRGADLKISLPQEYVPPEYYRTHSPADLWQSLRASPLGERLTSQQLWDLVAWAWQSHSTPETLAEGQKLYAQNCASCHGESGAGNGVFAKSVQAATTVPSQSMPSMDASSASTPAFSGNETMPPADFTVPGMLAQNPARWQGKILRGGMGTGMPYWGPIFTDAQTWALVDYLWTFSMEYSYAKK